MDLFSSDLVRPLKFAENHFLEVLLSKFTLRRKGEGSELEVHFNDDTPAIWMRHAKYHVRETIVDFDEKATDYQAKLDEFLLRNQGDSFEFDDPGFFFRYASGGALPVLRFELKEYYCLFYRDIFPIGWNIANGGCDTRDELLYPIDAVERELREELIVVDLGREKRYVFEGDEGKPLDRPEFAIARRFWQEQFPHLEFPRFEERRIPLKWLYGPDSVVVQIGGDPARQVGDCFLNINAEDFGIEIDRVAKLNLDEDVVLCDGEITQGRLINRLVGLFEVGNLNPELERGTTDFCPDLFFYSAQRYGRGQLQQVIDEQFFPQLRGGGLRTCRELAEYESTQKKFDLCPVTRRIIQRRLSLQAERRRGEAGPFEVFLTFGGDDEELAAKVYDVFQQMGIRTFFSRESLNDPDFGKMVDDALLSAKWLIAVGTQAKNLERRWPAYEWRAFHHLTLDGRKPEGKIIPFISGFDHRELPLPLSIKGAIVCDSANLEPAFQKLLSYVKPEQHG